MEKLLQVDTRIPKDIAELVTNKLNSSEFLQYVEIEEAEGKEHSSDFWIRRLRKDFAPLFAKNAIELKEAREKLEIPLVKEMKVELEKSDKKPKQQRKPCNPPLDYERTLHIALPNFIGYPKEAYVRLMTSTLSTILSMVNNVISSYGPFGKFMLGTNFEKIASNILFGVLMEGFFSLQMKIQETFDIGEEKIDNDDLEDFVAEHFWDCYSRLREFSFSSTHS